MIRSFSLCFWAKSRFKRNNSERGGSPLAHFKSQNSRSGPLRSFSFFLFFLFSCLLLPIDPIHQQHSNPNFQVHFSPFSKIAFQKKTNKKNEKKKKIVLIQSPFERFIPINSKSNQTLSISPSSVSFPHKKLRHQTS